MTSDWSNTNATGQQPAPETKSQPARQRSDPNYVLGTIQQLPIDLIKTDYLWSDRAVESTEDLSELMTSLRSIGMLNPIRVQISEAGDYQLIQGFRRLSAYHRLLNETGDDFWSRIPGLLSVATDDKTLLYRQVIDENTVRKPLTLAAMADAARRYAMDPAMQADTVADAIDALFVSAKPAGRDHIRRFARLLDQIGDFLRFPLQIPKSLGLALAREIEMRPELVGLIRSNLKTWQGRTLENELDVLRIYARRDRFEMPVHQSTSNGSMARLFEDTNRVLSVNDCTVNWHADDNGARVDLQTDRNNLTEAEIEAGIRAFVAAIAPGASPPG